MVSGQLTEKSSNHLDSVSLSNLQATSQRAALKFVAVNVYIFSWSFPTFLASSLSQSHTHSHTLMLPPLHFGEPLVHSPVSLSQAHVHSHNPLQNKASLLSFLFFNLFLLMTAKSCKVKDDLSGNNWSGKQQAIHISPSFFTGED